MADSELRNLSDRELLWSLHGELREVRNELSGYQERLDERCETRCAKIDRQEASLYGNGQTGLISKVGTLWWALTIFGGVVSAAVGGIILHLLTMAHRTP